jgi:glycosyltransferase involved in cell wall biosynthesis
MRILFPSASAVMTDHLLHGEALIAHNLLRTLTHRGHTVVALTRHSDYHADPPYKCIPLGRRTRISSVEPIRYLVEVRRALQMLGGTDAFDVAHWLFPQSMFDLAWRPVPDELPLVVGPLTLRWPVTAPRIGAPGDAVRWAIAGAVSRSHQRMKSRTDELLINVSAAAGQVPPNRTAAIVPFGIDADLYVPRPVSGQPTVVFPARLVAAKGIHTLLDAFADARRALPSATLVVAGDGPDRAKVEARAAADDLCGAVRILGPVSHDRVRDLIRESLVVCIPARGEPFGMAILEAMASGRAVIAGDQGGPRFLVADPQGGRLVRPDDRAALAGALIELLGDPVAAAELGRFNRQRVLSQFSLASVCQRLEDAYERAIVGARLRS